VRLPGPDLLGPLFGLSEIALSVFKRSGKDTVGADRNSLRLLWMVILGSVALAVMSAAVLPLAHSQLLEVLYPLGLALFVVGLLLRWYAIVHLGRFFTVNVAIAADHRVVDDGPYSNVRQPTYTRVLLAFLGYGICLGNWVSLLAVTVPVGWVFIRRIAIEEAALRTSLGESYLAYARRSTRLVPFVY
jgi:protein-S-isoprenylcysteine O-methyltransferase